MIIRLGYVANALRLADCTPSGAVTYKTVSKIPDFADRVGLITRVARSNLQNTLRILKANFFDGIQVYRFTSKLIPLATHPDFLSWDYQTDLSPELKEVGDFTKQSGMRVSLHPDHFTLLNSPDPGICAASVRDLHYHVNILETMGLDSKAKLVIHVGGKYGDRSKALERFKTQYALLPPGITERLTLENDDRCFTASEVLRLAQTISIPMVFDLHHHQILNRGESCAALLPEIFATWGAQTPKIHVSSPKDAKNPRHHGDYIVAGPVIRLIEAAKTLHRDFDIMVEAKQKDLALFKLATDLRQAGYCLPGPGKIHL
jgi:UV DNA damage endonuclease